MSSPKILNLGSRAPNPIVFPSFNPGNQTESQTRRPVLELPRLNLSLVLESSDDAMDDEPPEKQRHTDMDTFGNHHVV